MVPLQNLMIRLGEQEKNTYLYKKKTPLITFTIKSNSLQYQGHVERTETNHHTKLTYEQEIEGSGQAAYQDKNGETTWKKM